MAQQKEIVVAIDFGTTFSGVAWAQVSNPDAQYIINQWPYNTLGMLDGTTSEKVPSELAYQYEDSMPIPIWGFQIPDSMPRLQFIKLALEPEQKMDLKSNPRNNMSIEYTDSRRMNYPNHATPEGAIIDYLRALLNHVSESLKHKVGTSFTSMKFTYAITVPAIWSDSAKMTTLKCAEKAGMSASSRIYIISEPEAAAIHTLKASNPHGMDVGDTIVVCDAGGGTVDLITFKIVQLQPSLRLKEAAPGNGALCGGTYLNRKFEECLRQRLGSCEGWGEDTMDYAMQRFETTAKRQFAGDPTESFAFPVPGVTDNESLGVRRGCLHVTGEEINKLCLPVLEKVAALVNNQMNISRSDVKSIFLVGGFGQSPLLRRFLRNQVPQSVQIIAPVDGWTAVVRGALSKTIAEICSSAPQVSIESRVARCNYGEVKSVEFDPSSHEDGRKKWSAFHGHHRISIMRWIINKGDDIFESKPLVHRWHHRSMVENGKVSKVKHTIYELDVTNGVSLPLYYDSEKMKEHAVLYPELDPILRQDIPIVVGANNKKYYQPSYQVRATYYSAHCEYSLWFSGKNHGVVKVDYV